MTDLLSIQNRTRVPPGLWRYTQHESGYTVEGFDLEHVIEQVRLHRLANGYDLSEGWLKRLEDEMCHEMGIETSHCGRPGSRTPGPDGSGMGWRDVSRFFKVVREWMMFKKAKFVAPEIAEERASICDMCPYNQDIGECTTCFGLLNWVKEFGLAERKTSYDDKLKQCLVCKCYLKLKVHLPDEVNRAGDPPNAEWPSFCWQNRENATVS